MNDSLKKIGVILGVAAGLAAAGFYTLDRIAANEPGVHRPLSAILHAKKNAVTLTDQKPSDSVRVRSAALTADGYIVIYDDEEGPGKRLGASPRLKKGVTRNVDIKLQNPLSPGYYYAVLESDEGGTSFDADKDRALLGADGEVVMARFLAADDQMTTTDGGS